MQEAALRILIPQDLGRTIKFTYNLKVRVFGPTDKAICFFLLLRKCAHIEYKQ